MFFTGIMVVAVFACRVASGPIITPQDIVQSTGIGSLFEPEAESDFQSPDGVDGIWQFSQSPYALFGQHGPQAVHNLNREQSHGGHGFFDLHVFPVLHSFHGPHGFHESHGQRNSRNTCKVVSYNERSSKPAPSRSKSLLSGIISGIRNDFYGHKQNYESHTHNGTQKSLTPTQEEHDFSRSDRLLKGIITGIKKDIYGNEKPQTIILESSQETQEKPRPPRSEALLSGIMSGIRRDIYEHNSNSHVSSNPNDESNSGKSIIFHERTTAETKEMHPATVGTEIRFK